MSSPIHSSNCLNDNFACKRCCLPLKTHSTLNTINEQIIKELTNESEIDSAENLSLEDKPKNSSDLKVTYKVSPVQFAESTNGNEFLLIGDSTTSNCTMKSSEKVISGKLSDKIKMASQLFDILSEQSDIDHPLCEECADFVIDQMDHELRLLEDECREYKNYSEEIDKNNQDEIDLEEIENLKEKLEELQNTEKKLMEELDEIKIQHKQLDEELEKQTTALQRLYDDEDKYWHEYNNLRNGVFGCEDEQQSIDNQLRYAQAQLDRLKRTDVFNATFHIWHSGQFGTINNFRLGRLPNIPVEWSEINAAWGQAALLLYSLAKKIDLTFQRYKLVPYGNHSFLESLEDKSKELPLYASGGIRYFWNSKFDQAMVAFLDCLQQFKEEVEKGDSGFCLPYKMEKGKIEDTKTGTTYSIKIQFNSEEQWTKALKFMLTNLKWALAWVSAQFNNKNQN